MKDEKKPAESETSTTPAAEKRDEPAPPKKPYVFKIVPADPKNAFDFEEVCRRVAPVRHVARVAAARHPHRTHAERERGIDVLVEVVADHHRVRRRDTERPQRRDEHRGIGLGRAGAIAQLPRVDERRDRRARAAPPRASR